MYERYLLFFGCMYVCVFLSLCYFFGVGMSVYFFPYAVYIVIVSVILVVELLVSCFMSLVVGRVILPRAVDSFITSSLVVINILVRTFNLRFDTLRNQLLFRD